MDAEEPQKAEVDVVGQGKFDVIGNIEANVSEFVEAIFRGDANNDGKLSCEESESSFDDDDALETAGDLDEMSASSDFGDDDLPGF